MQSKILKYIHGALSFRLIQTIRQERCIERIRASQLFDESYYLLWNPQVSDASADPIAHYVLRGADEGSDPHPFFSTLYYQSNNSDLRRTHTNAFDHFIHIGCNEGRAPHPLLAARSLRRSGRQSSLKEAETLFASGFEENGLLLKAEFERRAGRSPYPLQSTFFEQITILPGAESDPRPANVTPEQKTIVMVAHVLPNRSRSGNEYRIGRILKRLESRGDRVIFIYCPLPSQEANETTMAEAAEEIRNLVIVHRDGNLWLSLEDSPAGFEHPLALGPFVSPLMQMVPEAGHTVHQAEHIFSPDVLVEVVSRLAHWLDEPFVILTNYVFNTRFLPFLEGELLKIIDTHDVFSTRQEKVGRFGIDDSLALRPEVETEMLSRGDRILAIQPEEAEILSTLVQPERVLTVGVDFDVAPASAAPLPDPLSTPSLLFIGSGNPLNQAGLDDFIRLIWPLVRRSQPGAILRVAGQVCQGVPKNVPGIQILGLVENLADLYRESHIVINPVPAGSGLKVKTLEALAHWRPVVTWPAGAEGLPRELSRFCRIVHDAYEFHLEIGKLLAEQKLIAIGEEAQRTVTACLSGLQVYATLEEEIDIFFANVNPSIHS